MSIIKALRLAQSSALYNFMELARKNFLQSTNMLLIIMQRHVHVPGLHVTVICLYTCRMQTKFSLKSIGCVCVCCNRLMYTL